MYVVLEIMFSFANPEILRKSTVTKKGKKKDEVYLEWRLETSKKDFFVVIKLTEYICLVDLFNGI